MLLWLAPLVFTCLPDASRVDGARRQPSWGHLLKLHFAGRMLSAEGLRPVCMRSIAMYQVRCGRLGFYCLVMMMMI